jgi:glutathionylspermidine synthase
MQRHGARPRSGWQAEVEAQGLIWSGDAEDPYWDESAYYAFTLEEIANDPTLMELFGIPDFCHRAIKAAWKQEPPSLNYGRFDLGYNGEGEPKLFEFNCDTPTSLLEAAVIQWEWKEQLFPELDQFNSLHEKLIGRWAALRARLPGQRVWFTHTADAAHEDTITTTYMRDLASQAGLETLAVLIDDIGVDDRGQIVDHEDQLITAIFKLYPWEWIVNEPYGPSIVAHLPETLWIEPIWKMLWSNKAILALLWKMFPGHPNLLAASGIREDIGSSYVAKPFLSREGANIVMVGGGETLAQTLGEYRDSPMLYQQLYPLRDFGNGYPVIGSWIVDGAAAGMGIREDGLITSNRARFVPHVIRG